MRPVFDMLNELGINMAAEAITREALIRELANASEIDPDLDNYTHASLTIFSQELTVFLGQNNWQLISDLTDWYDCRSHWTYRTKNMGEDEIHGVWVNLFGATTPDFLASSLPQDAIGGGLTSRIVFVYGDQKSKVVPFPLMSEDEIELQNLLTRDLSTIQMLKGSFDITKKFLEKYQDWYIATEENPPFQEDAFAGYNGRRSLHLRKLCMALCVSRTNKMLINGDDFDRALDILEKTESVMRYTFVGRGQAKNVKVFESLLRLLAHRRQMSIKQIIRRYQADITASDLKEIIATLTTGGYVKQLLDENGETVIVYVGKGGEI